MCDILIPVYMTNSQTETEALVRAHGGEFLLNFDASCTRLIAGRVGSEKYKVTMYTWK